MGSPINLFLDENCLKAFEEWKCLPPERRITKLNIGDMNIGAVDDTRETRPASFALASTCLVPTGHHILGFIESDHKFASLAIDHSSSYNATRTQKVFINSRGRVISLAQELTVPNFQVNTLSDMIEQ